jgi:hypothetical protein
MTDPTGTVALRRSFNAEANRRMSRLRSMTHAVLVERDLMLAKNDPVAAMLGQPGHRLAAFAQWFERVANEQLGGPWWERFLQRAYSSGTEAAGALTGRQPANGGSAPIVYRELANREFGGIAAAMTQQVSRTAAQAAITGRTPRPMYQMVLGVLRKIGQSRLKTAVDTLVVQVHNAARLAHFEQAGITQVGLIPEMLEPPRPSRFGLQWVRHDHAHHLVRDDVGAGEFARQAAQQRVDEAQRSLVEAELAETQAQAKLEVAQARVETAQAEAERTLGLAQEAEAVAEQAPEQLRANAETQAARANIKASNAAVKETEMRTAQAQAQEEASAAFQAAEQARKELAEAQLQLAQATEPDVFKIETAGDDRVCKICLAAAEDSYSLDEARGLLPLHPRCRCSWVPSLPQSN